MSGRKIVFPTIFRKSKGAGMPTVGKNASLNLNDQAPLTKNEIVDPISSPIVKELDIPLGFLKV